MKKIGILLTHPVQYNSPFFKEFAKLTDLIVYYCHQPSDKEQGLDFGIAFKWDTPLFEGYKYKFIYNVKEIQEAIHNEKFDMFIVFGWNYKAAQEALRACRKRNIPIFARGDSQLLTRPLWLRILKRICFKKYLRKFDGFLAPSQRFKEYLLFYGVARDKIIFCPHFVDNEFFSKNALQSHIEKNEMRRKYGFSGEDIILLFCGKFIDKKRPLDFLRAIKNLKEKGIKVRALMVGEGKQKAQLQDYSTKHGLDAVFLGFINQTMLPAIYSMSDCLVLPSDAGETWGLVVNEAFACGVPAIISDQVGCCPDLIDEGKTGYIFRCGDVKALTLKILCLIEAKNKAIDFSPFIFKKTETYSIKKAISSILNYLQN